MSEDWGSGCLTWLCLYVARVCEQGRGGLSGVDLTVWRAVMSAGRRDECLMTAGRRDEGDSSRVDSGCEALPSAK